MQFFVLRKGLAQAQGCAAKPKPAIFLWEASATHAVVGMMAGDAHRPWGGTDKKNASPKNKTTRPPNNIFEPLQRNAPPKDIPLVSWEFENRY
jgi:hypothetical protein